MKRKDLEKCLRTHGWWFARHGRRHDIWTDGERELAVPRHKELNEYTAMAILKEAKGEKR